MRVRCKVRVARCKLRVRRKVRARFRVKVSVRCRVRMVRCKLRARCQVRVKCSHNVSPFSLSKHQLLTYLWLHIYPPRGWRWKTSQA